MKKTYDLILVGAGSGGIGAAISAGQAGLTVLLVEKSGFIGGTAAWAGVNNWEPGVGSTPLAHHIYKKMREYPNGAGITSLSAHICRGDHVPGGLFTIDPSKTYDHTLRSDPRDRHSVVFEPKVYARVVEGLLAEAGVEYRLQASIKRIKCKSGCIESLELDGAQQVRAPIYIDSTGSNVLARMAGCQVITSPEPHHIYKEPSAPDVVDAGAPLNGATLVFRISRSDSSGIEPVSNGTPGSCWWADNYPYVFMAQYPCGDIQVNALPTMAGREALDLGHDKAYAECHRRSLSLWHHIQRTYPTYQQYRLTSMSPVLGIRQDCRVRARRMLTEIDVRDGLSRQDTNEVIAIADHPLDVHGEGHLSAHLNEPYGIPFGCLVPLGMSNLLIASRGAGFSHIAASSCRLSRTMMALGEVAGHAAFQFVKQSDKEQRDIGAIDLAQLRERLKQHGHTLP